MNTILILLSFCIYSIQSIPVYEPLKNPMENPDLFGGDMTGIKFREIGDRKAIPSDAQRWPGKIIYYTIDNSLKDHVTLIQKAMEHIQNNTCIRFEPRTNQRDYVNFFLGSGCYSQVGRTGGPQQLSLGMGCHWLRTAAHEMMHAIGFFHEWNRSDRDKYLTIHLENVEPKFTSQFAQLQPNQNRLLTAFDFTSIMLSGPKAFSKNGGITMQSKVAGKNVVDYPMSQGLSENDIFSINTLYHC